jgi:hypothetical protein
MKTDDEDHAKPASQRVVHAPIGRKHLVLGLVNEGVTGTSEKAKSTAQASEAPHRRRARGDVKQEAGTPPTKRRPSPRS